MADIIIVNIPKTYDFRLSGEISQEKINDYINPPYNCLIYDFHEYSKIDSLFHLDGKYNRNNLNIKSSEILNELKNNNKFINIH
jgi:hypothetical protein